MTVRFDTFFTDYTRHFADATSRANRLALESAESALDVQLRVFESNTTATADFFGELAQGGANVPALLPKGLQLARDNLQRLATAGQEILGLGVKTSLAFGELARQPLPAAQAQPRKTR